MFNVVLYEPEIPPNTGNVIRLCANTGCRLHLIEPLGFSLNEKQLKRAALDYREMSGVSTYSNWDEFLERSPQQRVFTFSTKHTRRYTEPDYQPADTFLFGAETRGLPDAVRRSVPDTQRLTVPMRPDNRSINLANTVAVIVYEAWRQHEFEGGAE